MRPSTIMPGYLLGAKPFPGPMLIISPGFILNYTHNEHELDPNLCVFIEHYDISKPVCGHWIYPFHIKSKQTLFMYHEQSKTGLMQYVWPALRSGFAVGHRVALVVVHRAQKYVPTRPLSDPHFRLRRWRAALGLMLMVRSYRCNGGVFLFHSTVNAPWHPV